MNNALLKNQCNALIEQTLRQISGLSAIVVSTSDGFEIASQTQNTAQVNRLAALASSLSALGQVAGEESQLGECDAILVQSRNGFLAVMSIQSATQPLTLSLVAGPSAVLGQVLHAGKLLVKTLRELVG